MVKWFSENPLKRKWKNLCHNHIPPQEFEADPRIVSWIGFCIFGGMKTIYFNRHAKSDWSHDDLRDFDRPLNNRGFRDAPKMGERLKQRGEKIDQFISSPAKRAITTARLMADKYNFPVDEIKEVERLYLPSIGSFLDTISETDESHRSVILFAHNPGITEVVEYLSGEEIGNIPTCGIAKIEFASANNWNEISAETGKMIFFDFPKNDNPFN